MANVLLNWDAPADTANVDGIVVLRKTEADSAATQPACDDFIAADTVRTNTADDIQSGIVQVGSDVTSGIETDGSVTDTGVDAGNYFYAAFSYNAAGYSPCDVTDTILTIS
jgi:hypothetical protein